MNIVERVAGSEAFLRMAPKVIPRLDNFIYRLSGGKVMLSGTYMPALRLTAIGRKSGQPRTVPLATIPHGDALIVIGSNFGREHHPAWSSNLLANPEATVEYRGKTFPVKARLADPDEKTALWPMVIRQWPNFDKYTERSGRDLRLFLLERQ